MKLSETLTDTAAGFAQLAADDLRAGRRNVDIFETGVIVAPRPGRRLERPC